VLSRSNKANSAMTQVWAMKYYGKNTFSEELRKSQHSYLGLRSSNKLVGVVAYGV